MIRESHAFTYPKVINSSLVMRHLLKLIVSGTLGLATIPRIQLSILMEIQNILLATSPGSGITLIPTPMNPTARVFQEIFREKQSA